LAGVAVKTTGLPMQDGFVGVVTVTLTGCIGLTVMMIVFDVAGFPEMQDPLDVILQLIS
jgi:hypothetical protein